MRKAQNGRPTTDAPVVISNCVRLFNISISKYACCMTSSPKYLAKLFTRAEGPSFARKLSLIPRQILARERPQTSYRTVLQFSCEMSFQILVHALSGLFKIIWCSEHGFTTRDFFIKGKFLAKNFTILDLTCHNGFIALISTDLSKCHVIVWANHIHGKKYFRFCKCIMGQ